MAEVVVVPVENDDFARSQARRKIPCPPVVGRPGCVHDDAGRHEDLKVEAHVGLGGAVARPSPCRRPPDPAS